MPLNLFSWISHRFPGNFGYICSLFIYICLDVLLSLYRPSSITFIFCFILSVVNAFCFGYSILNFQYFFFSMSQELTYFTAFLNLVQVTKTFIYVSNFPFFEIENILLSCNATHPQFPLPPLLLVSARPLFPRTTLEPFILQKMTFFYIDFLNLVIWIFIWDILF